MNPTTTRMPSPQPLPAETREALMQALRMNWDHARHIEVQRIALNLAYVGAMGAAASFLLANGQPLHVSVLLVAAAFFLTFLCGGMTYKWNMAFDNQIQRADRCARAVLVTLRPPLDGVVLDTLHSFVGFPVRDPRPYFKRLNVKAFFAALYVGSEVFWSVILWHVLS